MNSKKKTIIIGLIVVLLLVGVLLALKLTAPEKKDTASSQSVSTATAYPMIDKDIAEFSSASFKNAKDEFVITKIDDTNYGIESLKKYTQNPTYCANTVNDLSKLNAKTKVLDELADGDKAKYGLDNPIAQVTVKYSDTEYVISLGSSSPDKGYYAIISGDTALYTVNTSLGDMMLRNAFYYVDKVLVEAYDKNNAEAKPDVTKLTVERGDLDKPIILEKYSGDDTDRTYMSAMQMVSPIISDVNFNSDTEYIDKLFGMTAEDIIAEYSEADAAKYGFDAPTAKIGFEFDGKVRNIVVGSQVEVQAPETTDSKTASEPDNTTTYYNVIVGDNGLVYKVSKDSLLLLEATGNDFITKLGILPNIVTISTVDLTMDGTTYNFGVTNTPDPEDEKVVDTTSATCNGKEIDVDNFKQYYQLLLTASIEKINTTPVSNAPSVKISYNYTDGKSDTVELYEEEGRRLIVSINGEPKYEGRSAYIEKLRSETTKLLEGKKVDTDL